MKRSLIIVFVFFALTYFCSGQKLTFSPMIQSSEDTSVQAIAQLWEDYIKQLWKDFVSVIHGNPSSDSMQKSFWHNGSEDMMKGRPPMPFYLFSDILTFKIRKYSDIIYEIHSMQQRYDLQEETISETPLIFYIYKTGAIQTEEGFKLMNWFDIYKSSLQNYTSENIEYYYPCGFDFDMKKVEHAEKFIQQFRKNYNLKKTDKKIIYIIGNNYSESNYFMGFDFTAFSSEKKHAAYCLFPRTVLACFEDHIHELVHALMYSEYPDALGILNEGIATYYGGVSNMDYILHRSAFKKYIRENPIDFLDTSLFYNRVGEENVSLLYVLGGLIIEYALKNHGTDKVIELFSCKEYQEIYTKLGITSQELVDFLLNN